MFAVANPGAQQSGAHTLVSHHIVCYSVALKLLINICQCSLLNYARVRLGVLPMLGELLLNMIDSWSVPECTHK